MRLLLLTTLIFACEKSEPDRLTSHPPMQNQLEVGSTIDGRYHVVKKLGEVGDHQFFVVEHDTIERTLIAPRFGREHTASKPLADAALRERTLQINDVGRLPHGASYVIVTAEPDVLRELLAGTRSIGS